MPCSGIPKNVGGSIKENTRQHLTFAKARLADLTIPELEQSRAAVLNTLASAQSRLGHQGAIEWFIEWHFGILTLAESSAQIGGPDS